MVSKNASMVITPSKWDCDKHTSEAIALHNASQIQKRNNPLILEPTIPSNRKWKDIPYEKLIIIAELLK